MEEPIQYKAYSVHNFRKIPQVQTYLTEEECFEIEVVGRVLPFKVNNYVVDCLINWENFRNDPMFILTFPQKEMLDTEDFLTVAKAIKSGANKTEMQEIVNEIRLSLNPHPAGQMSKNVPTLDGQRLTGIQHKYRETVLFFPKQGQTCHAYCTFCFRWPQFVGMDEMKFGMKETELLIEYLHRHPEVTDILFTGGDPMIMRSKIWEGYLNAILEHAPNIRNIRIGTKALGYWPQRFVNDKDADELLALFEKVQKAGKKIALMAHFNHTVELKTDMVKEAIQRLQNVGVEIRSQSPVMRKINDRPDVWRDMWKAQVKLGIIPYYMFIARDTGAQDYFAVPLEKCWNIFRKAYQQVSGLNRTVRGPSMSAGPGKVQVLGVTEIADEKVFALRFIQGRNPDWVHRPFFAKYDPDAIWLDELEPAFGKEKFFYQEKITATEAN
ncbi:MAG: hypothetical protein R2879_17210 [Saprospiraceae bacterium]